jgi:hypothetical protein
MQRRPGRVGSDGDGTISVSMFFEARSGVGSGPRFALRGFTGRPLEHQGGELAALVDGERGRGRKDASDVIADLLLGELLA